VDRLAALLQDIEDKICDDDTLIDQYTKIEGMTPLDIMVEKERRREAIEILKIAFPALSRKDRKILWLYGIRGLSQVEIGKRARMNQSSVARRIDRIHRKVQKLLQNYSQYDDWKDTFRPPQSKEEAHTPETRGYPYDIMMKVGVECVKVKLDGVIHYRSRWECRIPEYLRKAFGNDDTICNICDNCSRPEMQRKRKGTQKRAAA